jgi:hypothetical protein
MQIVISETFGQLDIPRQQGLLVLEELCQDGSKTVFYHEPILPKPIATYRLANADKALKKSANFKHQAKLLSKKPLFVRSNKDEHITIASAKSAFGALTALYYGFQVNAKNARVGKYITMATLLYSSYSFMTSDRRLDNSMRYMETINPHFSDSINIIALSTLGKVYSHY